MKKGLYTLSEAVELYCVHTDSDKRKNFDKYLIYGKAIWNELLKNTLWSFQSIWLSTNKGNPYPYVTVPECMEQFLGLYYEDACGKLVPVHQSRNYSLIPKPQKKTCGCQKDCGCDSLCSAVNSFTFTTKNHLINATTYQEKIWTEVCANGDVIRHRQIPTKTPTGVTVIDHTDVVCKLEVRECGCVTESDSNKNLLNEYCGCDLAVCNSNLYAPQAPACETTMQFDEGRIYLIGKDVKEWYMIHYRAGDAAEGSLIPEMAMMTFMRGMDYRSKAFNPRIHRTDKKAAQYDYEDAKLKLVQDLNPIDLEFIYKLQNEKTKW